MSVLGTVIVGIVILIGVIGAVVQVWPSAPLVGGAILVWSWMTGTRAAWIIFAVVALVLILGTVLKYVIPARGMNKAGIPPSPHISANRCNCNDVRPRWVQVGYSKRPRPPECCSGGRGLVGILLRCRT